MVATYGDDPKTRFQTDDSVYRDLALHLEISNGEIARIVVSRCRSIYVSLAGVLLTLVGLGGIYADVLG